MNTIIIENALVINEGHSFIGAVLIKGERIEKVFKGKTPEGIDAKERIDATGKWLMPGVIDDQVHFREPGLTHKGDIASESTAAIAGGVTSFIEMPNTNPQTTTLENFNDKLSRAAETSRANYGFMFGGTNDNFSELQRLDQTRVAALKLFLGSSTGNMLVDKKETLEKFFTESNMLIAVHAESEEIIKKNKEFYTNKFGTDLESKYHSLIRNEEACYASSSNAVELATRLGTRLHLFHLSTAKELTLLSNKLPLEEKLITGEVCVHHLWFTDEDYATMGNRIKWNPSVKSAADRDALRKAVAEGTIDIVATDHAPHLWSEKQGSCLTAASGGPLVQHSLLVMLELAKQGHFTPETVVQTMAHNPATLYKIEDRGYIKPGYFADLVIVDPSKKLIVNKENILYKCQWSPLEETTFSHTVDQTFVNGQLAYSKGAVSSTIRGRELRFRN